MSAPASGDKAAAFKGLVVTTILLAVMAYSIVLLTNRTHARELLFANINAVRRQFHSLAIAEISSSSQ